MCALFPQPLPLPLGTGTASAECQEELHKNKRARRTHNLKGTSSVQQDSAVIITIIASGSACIIVSERGIVVRVTSDSVASVACAALLLLFSGVFLIKLAAANLA